MNDGADEPGRVVVAVDAQLDQPLFHIGDACIVETDDLLRPLAPHSTDEQFELKPHAAGKVARIAPTGAKAGKFLLEDDDFGPASRQL
ncbi:hypothetical protein D3C73_1489880 [compost metagenome]